MVLQGWKVQIVQGEMHEEEWRWLVAKARNRFAGFKSLFEAVDLRGTVDLTCPIDQSNELYYALYVRAAVGRPIHLASAVGIVISVL